MENKLSALIEVDSPTPIAFLNVFENGDKWVKIKGCEDCPEEWRKKCCGNCPLKSDKGCSLHLQKPFQKPFSCIITPSPYVCKKNCVLEYRCVEGKNEGKIRRVTDIRNVIKDI